MMHSSHSAMDAETLTGRLYELWERTGDAALRRVAEGRQPHTLVPFGHEQERSDWTSTSLMDCYKNTGDAAVFALLYELNRASFLHAIHCGLRRVHYQVDEQDVLQEVFLNIYRYPHRFLADRPDAFRGWGHRIVRNTLLKFLKGQSRLARFHEMNEEVLQPEDVRTRRPDRVASEAESASVVNHAYVLYLQLYWIHFRQLSPKERVALTMVEIDGVSYRDAAAALGIRLENLKMVIFRGRRKIFRGMERSLETIDQASVPSSGAPPRRTGSAGPMRRGAMPADRPSFAQSHVRRLPCRDSAGRDC
ncbi:MAG: RNA polymerase sigma factor [Planctomycetes bacterium]|nr:RNA polymerase sigma factor [Planctomycetota bacterium]